MKIAVIRKRLVELGVPESEIKVKYAAGRTPHVCILTTGVQYTCVAAPIDDEQDEAFAEHLLRERNKARTK